MNGTEQRWNAVRSLLRAQAGEPPLAPVPRTADLPASFAQEALWFLDRLEPNSTAYHLTVACRLEGVLDVPALERSLSELVARHEILRTTLRSSGGAVVQQVEPPRAVALAIEDVRTEQVEPWASECAELPFALELRPPFRVHLARLAPDDHCLVLAVHHSIFDGWSFEVFMRELCALYGAFRRGDASPLAAPRAALR